MHRFALLLSLLFAFASPSFAQTAEEQQRLDWVQQRGRLLFEIDRAAWVGTDDMLAQIADAASSGMRGYLVEREGNGFAVIFFGGPPDAPVAFYRGIVENRRVVSRQVFPADGRPALTPAQRRLADARDIIIRDVLRDLSFCARSSPNFAIIPPDAPDGPIDVYVLTPQEQTSVFPFGGHHRVRISASGQVLERRRFTNTCVNMPIRDQRGNQPVGLNISHLLDPIPTEIHVFLSIWTGLPLGVATPASNRVWMIENERIRIIGSLRDTPTS
jgi:hypothetical protein